jgi:hypothetical protein
MNNTKFLMASVMIYLAVLMSPGQDGNTEYFDGNAKRIWDMAVMAQGGRQKLLSIRNEVITFSASKDGQPFSESLYVLPDKWWNFEDSGTKMFGRTMRMEDYHARQNYILRKNQRTADLFPIASERLRQSLDANGNVKWMPLSTFLLETKWWIPEIRSARSAMIDGRTVDVVNVMVNGFDVDFFFDPDTHLCVRRKVNGSTNSQEATDLSEYANVDGIMVPTRITYKPEGVVKYASYKFNVRYDEKVFVQPPLPAEFGAWSPTMKH